MKAFKTIQTIRIRSSHWEARNPSYKCTLGMKVRGQLFLWRAHGLGT